MGSYFGISTAGSTDTDQLVQAYRQTKQPQLDKLKDSKRELETARSFYNAFNSRITSLVSALDEFDIDSVIEKFDTRKITSSDSSVISATVNSQANIGNFNIQVNKIATGDNLISNRLTLEESYGISAGDYSFTVKSGEVSKEISVTLDGDETNEEAMNKIVSAINNDEELEISASMIKDTSTTGRISLIAQNSGEDYRIEISNDNGLLSPTGFDKNLVPNDKNRKTLTDTKAGYALSDSSELNSKLTINGINVERNSNSIDDLIAGTTINLIKAQESDSAPVTLTTEIDTDAVANAIKPILDNYNATLSHLGSNKDLRRNDPSISSLQSRIRSLPTQAITSENYSENRYLMEIGISVDSSGKLSLSDKEKLEDALKEDPAKVAELFTGENGFINKIKNSIEGLTGSEGLIQTRRDNLTTQINYNEKRTQDVQNRIDQEADNLRKEYSSYLETFLEAQGQYSLLSTMASNLYGGSGSGYDSLLSQAYS
jgi:flagellar hook-associated protein 2